MPSPLTARVAAAHLLVQVFEQGRSLNTALPAIKSACAPDQRALLQELAYGVLREAPRLEQWLASLLARPLKPRDRDLHALLLLGLYQLEYLRIPAHAAVALTVAATRELGKPWASGLVNGVLRRFQREAVPLRARADADDKARFAHPSWLLDAIRTDWPQQWQDILLANNMRPPLTLRVNAQRSTRKDYLARLAQAGIEAQPLADAPTGVLLATPCDVAILPKFAEGFVSVQDGAAQQAAWLLAPSAGMKVLDACAAPGGKTAHLLEQAPDIDLLALDQDAVRLQRVASNLDRLGLTAKLKAADARRIAGWWDGEPFNRILLDAPCSASGVIRRHPDIKYLRKPCDIPTLAQQQAALLRALWPTLAPGGQLLYATCSVLRQENEDVVLDFLRAQPDATPLPMDLSGGTACKVGVQLLPGRQEGDGFYYALLEKHT